MRRNNFSQSGLALVELLWSLAIAAVLIVGLMGVVGSVLGVQDDTMTRNESMRQARFAMQRMVVAVRQTDRLLLPLADNPNTNWRENVREQSVPPAPPEGASTLATAVLAVTIDPTLDRDEDGWADANNDRDYLDLNNNAIRDSGEPERIDEDSHQDTTHDIKAGILGIDDDGDGLVDEGAGGDDDEDGADNDDPHNGIDDDGDGAVDEDPDKDLNMDGFPGKAGTDDDHDGTTDEGNNDDDDEDGFVGEDWLDPVVFFLSGTTLMERLPNLNPTDGTDYTEYLIADNVSHFRVERIAAPGKRAVLVDITLELTSPGGGPTSLSTRVRVGGGQ